MKKILKNALILAAILPSLTFAQDKIGVLKFNFEGKQPAGKIYIHYNLYGPNIIDSIVVTKKEEEFKIPAKQATQVTLVYSSDVRVNKNTPIKDTRTIYVEEGTANIKIKNSIKEATITGMSIIDDYDKYLNHLKPSESKFAIIREKYDALTNDQKQDLKYTKPLFDEQDSLNLERKKLVSEFIKENPSSLFSTHGLRGIHHLLTPIEFDQLFNTLSETNQISSVGSLLQAYLKAAKVAGVGVEALDFTQNDVNGKPVKLSDFRGQYVLLDFWASWCAPCRAENPNVVKNYHKYKDKGFTVLGVSLDSPNGKTAWLNAIEKDGLEWTNVSDLKGWKNEASNLYLVRAVPQNYLIDPNGIIIAVNLKGYKLGEKLEEIFNK